MYLIKKIWNTNGGGEVWEKHPDLERARDIARSMSIEEASTSKEWRVIDERRKVVGLYRDGISQIAIMP
jgi:hypothetical protein